MALTTVHTVKVCCHEDTWTTGRADLAKTLHLSRVINLVQLEHTELHLLVLVLLLLWGGVGLLLTLLTSSQQSQRNIQLRVVRHTACGKTGIILKLTSSKENTLLSHVDSLACGNSSLDVCDESISSKVQYLGTIYMNTYMILGKKVLLSWLVGVSHSFNIVRISREHSNSTYQFLRKSAFSLYRRSANRCLPHVERKVIYKEIRVVCVNV